MEMQRNLSKLDIAPLEDFEEISLLLLSRLTIITKTLLLLPHLKILNTT